MSSFAILLFALISSSAQAQAPADWDEISRRASELLVAGKAAQAIALLEPVVARAPDFERAEYELGKAHQLRVLELAVERPSQKTVAGVKPDVADNAPRASGVRPAASARPDVRRHHLSEAARHFRRIADRRGAYRQPALGQLLMVYDEDELDMPGEQAEAARAYIALDARSLVGHVALARALRRTGKEADALSALAAASAVVGRELAPALALAILTQLIDSSSTEGPTSPRGQTSRSTRQTIARLLDYVDTVVDGELARDASDREALRAKASALLLRAQRLEADPARRRALNAKADTLLARLRATARGAQATPSNGPETPSSPPEPAGFRDAREKADALAARKAYAEAAAVYETFIASNPAFVPPHYLRVGLLMRAGQTAAIEPALRAARQATPATYESRYFGAIHLEEAVRSNAAIRAADATPALAEAAALLDEALARRPEDMSALTFKSLVLRAQARFASDPSVKQRLISDAKRLQAAAHASRAKR